MITEPQGKKGRHAIAQLGKRVRAPFRKGGFCRLSCHGRKLLVVFCETGSKLISSGSMLICILLLFIFDRSEYRGVDFEKCELVMDYRPLFTRRIEIRIPFDEITELSLEIESSDSGIYYYIRAGLGKRRMRLDWLCEGDESRDRKFMQQYVEQFSLKALDRPAKPFTTA